MNSTRSYLQSLNAGRQRRPLGSVRDLDRTFETLESRLRSGAPAEDGNHPLENLARDIEQTRMQEQGMASVSQIAGELKDMRDELRHQMTEGLKLEFDALRRDIERAYAGGAEGHGGEMGAELERLSDAIQSLAERSDSDSVNKLRLEIEGLRGALAPLAREDTVRSVGERWDEFDKRWNEERREVPEAALEAVNVKLEQISSAVKELPESLSLASLGEKIRTLAGVIDQFSREQQHAGPQAFESIGERLDEISRAIAAAPVATVDPQPFERIEARITSLARQIEELADERPVREQAVKTLTQQVEAIAAKLDTGRDGDADRLLRGLDGRFNELSAALAQRQSEAAEQGQMLFSNLERRFEEFTGRLEIASAAPADAAAIRSLEARLQDISVRLELSARQAAGVYPELIRNLEAQVAGLSEHLSRPGAPLPEFEDIAPRLERIEQSVAQSRDTVLVAARQAAEETIRGFAGSRAEGDAGALAGHLKSLEMLTRKSDERNVKTFEAIHDTLLKIVERLAALETFPGERRGRASPAVDGEVEGQGKLSLDAAPSMEPEADDAPLEEDEAFNRSPSEAAAAAALAALAGEADQPARRRRGKRSMLSGIGRAFARRGSGQEPAALAGNEASEGNLALAPELDLDEPLDPKIANRPLEPGSGAPDLSAIMKRVRDERAPLARTSESDAAKSDFIAAARRAAQAAAAEAEILKKQADKKGSEAGKPGLGGLLRSRRKTLLMAVAATTLALAGMQFGKGFLAGVKQPAAEAAAPAEAFAAKTAALNEPAVQAAAVVATKAPDAPATTETSSAADAPAAEPKSVSMEDAPPAPAMAAATPAPETAAPAAITPDAPEPEMSEPKPAAPQSVFSLADIPEEAGPLALREAAAAGDAKALFAIGERYAEGRGVAENLAEAAKWYEKAAAQGLAPAQYRIGNLYEKGLGVSRDIAMAKSWYQRAAEQGNSSAMHNLAVLLAMGADGAPDNDAAARWFIEAAELGVTDSQFNLGILAAKGVGMPQNLEESYKWFALVAKSGDQDAASKRDEVAKALTPEKLERARAKAELWRAKPLDPEANAVEVPDSWNKSGETTASVDVREAVKDIQFILNAKGYDAGSADGVMGEQTKAAIAAFQKANGMPSTGEVDEQFVQALLETR